MREQLEILLGGKPMLVGTLEKRFNVCGKAGCRCKDKDNPRMHGPYYRLSFNLKGRNSSIFVPEKDAPAIEEMTKNYRDARSSLQDLGLEMLDLYRHHGREGMLSRHIDMVNQVVCKKTGGKPPSGVLRDLRISRDNWKSKAMERQTTLEKNRIKIRDLTTSRTKWKKRAMDAQARENALKNELTKVKKMLKCSVAENKEAQKKTTLKMNL